MNENIIIKNKKEPFFANLKRKKIVRNLIRNSVFTHGENRGRQKPEVMFF